MNDPKLLSETILQEKRLADGRPAEGRERTESIVFAVDEKEIAVWVGCFDFGKIAIEHAGDLSGGKPEVAPFVDRPDHLLVKSIRAVAGECFFEVCYAITLGNYGAKSVGSRTLGCQKQRKWSGISHLLISVREVELCESRYHMLHHCALNVRTIVGVSR